MTSSVAAAHAQTLLRHGAGGVAALTGGLQWAMWVCGATGVLAIPVAFALIRRGRGGRPGEVLERVAKPNDLAVTNPRAR